MAVRSPFIAIVGLPNVGKSTLFNRLIGERKAVVEDMPGVTRDRNYARVDRYDIPFTVIDTGGFAGDENDPLQKQVREQTLLAIEEADIIFALFDGTSGVRPGDSEIVSVLRRCGKQVHYLVNKIDGVEQEGRAVDFYQLGVPELVPISAKQGLGVGDIVERALEALPHYSELLQAEESKRKKLEAEQETVRAEIEEAQRLYVTEDEDEDAMPEDEPEPQPPIPSAEHEFPPVFVPSDIESEKQYESRFRLRTRELSGDVDAEAPVYEDDGSEAPVGELPPALPLIRIAIIGRPNVGKSTLLNTIAGEERAITSELSGTTRDSIDLPLLRDGQEYILTDTAGMRKQGRIANEVERYSTVRALRSLADCDVAVVMLDATEGPTAQDAKIMGLAHDQGRAIVIAVNKWDLVKKDHRTVQEHKLNIRDTFKFAPYAPIIFVSAKTGRRCPWVLAEARTVAFERQKRVTTHELNRVLAAAMKRAPLPIYRGRPIKLYFGVQVETGPPRFVLFFNHPKQVHFSTLRLIKNALREAYGFTGTDIKLVCKKPVRREQIRK